MNPSVRLAARRTPIWRIENGKGVENWVQLDQLGMMQQLGVIPTPEPSGA